MSDRANRGQISQSAVENVQVGGNLTIGNITQFVGHRQPSFCKPTGIPQNIPHSGAAQFVGRARELEALHQQLQRTDRVAISAISGMGGVGKTELAIQYVIQYKSSYPGGVCWLKARASNLSDQLADFVQLHLGFAVPQELWGKILTLEQQVEWCWQHWQPSGLVLVVVDDVTDLASCREVLPPADRFRVVVTTRQRRLDPSFFELSLDVLSPEASLELLTALVDQTRIERELQTARKLSEWLGYLPLGLELVGRYLAEDPELSFTHMLERLEVQRLQDEAIANEQQRQNNYVLMTAQHSVRAAFELSWQELDIATSDVARLLGLFAPDIIPWELVESTGKRLNWSEQFINNARKQLYKRNLIQQAGEGYYKIHPLIREFLQTKLAETELGDGFKTAFALSIAAIEQVTKSPTIEQIHKIAPIIPHVTQATKTLIKYLKDEYLCKPFINLASFYEGQGLYNLAEPWREQGLSVAQVRLGSEHPDVAESLNGLAMLHLLQGRYSEAEPLFLQALELRKRLLGENHCHVAESLHGLAMVYRHQGRYSEAEPLFLQALELRKRLLGENDLNVAESLIGLVRLYYLQRRYREAESLVLQALEIRKRLLGDDHPLVAESLYALAGLYWLQKRYRKAEPLFVQVLELRKRLLGDDHPDIAESLNGLAGVYYAQKRYHKSEPLYEQALELHRRSLGDDHPDLALRLNNLATTYWGRGRYHEAESLLQQSLELNRHFLGDEHPQVAKQLNNLGMLYMAQGHYRKAESFFLQALEISKRTLETNHPLVALYRKNLFALFFWAIIQCFLALLVLQALLIKIFFWEKLEAIPFDLIFITGWIYPFLVLGVLVSTLKIIFLGSPIRLLLMNLFPIAFVVIGIKLTRMSWRPMSALNWLLTKAYKLYSNVMHTVYRICSSNPSC